MSNPTPLKVLFVDVETAPGTAYTFSNDPRFLSPGQFITRSHLLTWAAKWRGQKQLLAGESRNWADKGWDDTKMVADLAALIRQADVVVAQNGDRFDLPVINTRLLLAGAEPLGPVTTIDTYKLAKRDFRFMHNSLDGMARELGFEPKLKTDFDLWRRVVEGDVRAMMEMLKYNKHDVVLLEQVFEAILPYAKSVARLFDGPGCPNCGGRNLQKRGFHRTKASNFQTFQCVDCKRYSRARVSEKKTSEVVPI